ncbi:hypothetical protein DWV16_08220 [Anaerotruncus sp. AF02-27]|nr:hypothetical protein [Anaerotruncus sp. AF02-27]RGX55458.1 hypothetical protein DWV16_08220 [Anaerotruncus sp. AF02-27]
MDGMKLYQKRLAGSERAARQRRLPPGIPPAKLALAFLYDLSRAFSMKPSVYHTAGNRMLTLIFRDATFLCGDFIADYGEVIAGISQQWPVTVYGTASGKETGELRIRFRGEEILAERSCVSGKDFDVLSGLCVKIETQDARDSACFAQILRQMCFWQDDVAVPRTMEEFCRAQQLGTAVDGAYFCYLPLGENSGGAGRLSCLSMEQKAELWEVFLEDGVSTMEFDWLFSAGLCGEYPTLIEWELALQTVLEELGITVINRQDERFEVTGRKGRQMRFDFTHGSPAEKMFLKILFPVKPEDQHTSKK